MSYANLCNRSFQLQKIQLFNESPPIKRKILDEVKSAASELVEVVKHTASELEDLRKSMSSHASSRGYEHFVLFFWFALS